MAEERLNGLDYTAQSWNVGDPITQSRMMNIENAIETAFYRLGVKADTGGYGGSLQNLYTTLNNAITEVRNTANQAANDVSTATQNTMDGQHAWAALTGAGVIYDTHNGTFNPSLANILLGKADQTDLATEKERIDSIIATIGESGDNPTGLNKRISDITSSITAINTNINGAKDPNVVNDTLGARFNRIEGRISVNTSAIDTLNNSSGNNYATLAERLAAIDNNQLGGEPDGFRTLPAVDSELKAARGKDANDNDYATLSARLGANDTKVANVKATADNAVPKANIVHDLIHNGTYEVLGADQGAVITNNIATAKSEAIASANTYADTKIADTKIADNLTTDTPGYVLGAGQGKALNTRLSNAEAEIAAAHVSSVIRTNDAPTTFSNGIDERFENIEGIGVAAKTEIEDAHRTDLGVDEDTGLPIQDTLRTRFEAIESAAAASDSAIDGRLDALEDNVNGAKVQDGPQTLDARFDAVESRATQLETDVGTIANELSMVNTQTNAIQDTNSRIDTIEENVVAIGKEIGMLQDLDTVTDLSTAVSRNDTDIDKIKSELNDARIQIGTDENEDPIMGTLDDRFDANESDIAAINAKIGGNYDSSNTVTAAIEAAITTAETYTDTQNTNNKVAQINGANREHSGHFIEDEETHEQVEVADTLDLRFDDIEGRLDALDDDQSGMIAGLDARLDAIDGGAALTGIVLATRVDSLETKDTIVVNKPANRSNFTEGIPNIEDPSTTADYLIQNDDDEYYYWRYINSTIGWKLISGAGGGGSSSGLIRNELPSVSVGDPNVDYFIGDNTNGYIHYRFVEGVSGESDGYYIKILPTDIINSANVTTVTLENATEAEKWPSGESFSGGLEAYLKEDTQHENNLLSDFVAVRNARIHTTYDENNDPTSQKLQVIDTNGKLMEYDIVGGGGGSTGSLYTGRVDSTTAASRSIPTNNTDPVTISAKVIIQQGNTILPNATAEGVVQYRQKNTSTWNTGERIEVEANTEDEKYTILNDTTFTVDITQYLKEDITMEFRLLLTGYPAGEETITIYSSIFRVSQVNISIAAESFDYASVKTSNFQFNYRCFGSGIQKTVHFLLDGIDIVTANIGTSHNTVLYQPIDMKNQKNGMHTFQVYFTTNTGLQSNKLNYFILYNTDSTRVAPLIGAAAERTTITDGDEIIVNYSVYTPGSETTDTVTIELYQLDENEEKEPLQLITLDNVTNNILADPPYRTFAYPRLKKANANDPDPDPITVYITLTASHTINDSTLTDSQTISVQINYLNTKYDLEPAGENNLLYSYTAYGRSNNDAVKDTFVYPYKAISGQTINFTGTFNNFNWATDGYVDGESLIIGGGATYDINVPIFSQSYNNINFEENANVRDITENGRTIEIDYEVLSATKMDAKIIQCMGNNGVGFCVTPQNCYLVNSGSHIDIDSTGFIKNEENVAAAYLNPGTRTHLAFVIEPWAQTLAADGNYHQSTNIYINGEFANACPYNRNSTTGALDGNDFTTDATITIGSDTCLIKIYSIKLYNRGLTEAQILHNYEVAPVATRNKLTRLSDNDVLNELGQVDYEKARKKYTCLLLTGPGMVNGVTVPTMAPYKGYFSPMGRQKDGKTVGKTESGLLLTKPNPEDSKGYTVEFDLQDKLVDPNGYGFASSNNVQGTSSQKFPVKNLKIYLAKGKEGTEVRDESINIYSANTESITAAVTTAYTTVYEEQEIPEYITNCAASIAEIIEQTTDPTQEQIVTAIINYLNNNDTDVGAAYISPGNELVITHPIIPGLYTKSDKVKYPLRDKALDTVTQDSLKESTLCWKADYMSTDHANTFNANIANSLYSTNDKLSDRWTDKTQYAVYGIKCLLFQQNGENATPEFVGDGCLNNDKGNHKTFGLETDIKNVWTDDGNDTMCQKWDFRNNTSSLLFFKHDGLFEMIDGKPAGASCLECIYPDEGDLADEQKLYKEENNGASNPKLDVNYNHFQILSSWLGNRANYWYEDDPNIRAQKKQIFIDEFRNHFNFNHILIYYLFMEYTALCDNRVKNIHMRTDNAGEEKIRIKNTNDYYFDGNSNPNSGPWTLAENLETRIRQEPLIDENGDYQFDDETGNMILGNVSHVFVKDSVLETIDWEQGEGHSNFAIWAPVLYDLDSCFSADNVGYLKIRYDATWTYSLYNKLRFAGFDSILWLQVEDCFQDELKAKAKELYNKVVGLNYSTFYRQHITDNLASVCPAITNQDMILKFENPWTNGFIDYSTDPPKESTDKYKYLQRGTRTFQKAIFMKQRSLLLASKYDANEFKQDKITFRAGTEVNQEYASLTLVANQKLYHGVQYGDLNDVTKVTRRATKIYNADTKQWDDITDGLVPEFVPCIVKNTGNMGNTDGIEIYGASVLNDIGDLSRFHPWQLKVGNAVNLKKLILGSAASGFSNTSTTDIDGISACALLEEINVCNLKNLTSLSLSRNGFIKKVYATGSGLKTLSLPHGGVLNTIAYGDAITDITIINQSQLENFTYENAETNHYSNIKRLWIENTPKVPIVDIINHNIMGLTGGIRLIGVDIDLYSGNVTQQQNEEALEATTLFLNTLVSDVAKGKRLSAMGSLVMGDQYPEITGKIKITKIRESLLNKIKAHYKNLIIYANTDINGTPIEINGNDITREFEINYYNYGYVPGATKEENEQWLLFTDNKTDQEHYIDPVVAIDNVTGLPYLSIPTKPQDAQYTYTFGVYEEDVETGELVYVPYSGWKREGSDENPTADDYVQGTTTFIAQYPTRELRSYTVNWYAEPNQSAIQTITATYGTDISLRAQPEENNSLTKVKFDNVNNVYKVFKGWDKPIGKLTQNTNIYAQWETSSIGNSIQEADLNLSTINAADVYALANIGQEARIRALRNKLKGNEPLAIKMGHDFNYDPEIVTTTNLLGTAEKITLNGASSQVRIFNNLKLLEVLESDWTIALDYKLLMDSTLFAQGREFILLSCYKNANSSIQGFKVSLNKGTQVGDTTMTVHVTWGTSTTSVALDNVILTGQTNAQQYAQTYRNVIVLRHSAVSPETLYIYSTGHSGANYGNAVTSTTLTYSSRVAINSPLILGGNYDGNTTSIETTNTRRPAKAVIYYGKVWNADLGAKNCRLLAQWPHETEYFVLTGYDNNQGNIAENTSRILSDTKLSFASAQGLGDRAIPPLSVTGDNVGWNSSSLRTFCNERVFNAFPIPYQSIIQAQTITSNYYNNSNNTENETTTRDYIYLASEKEVNPSGVTTTYKYDEALRFWPWLSSENVKAFIVSEDNLVDMPTNSKPIEALRYRFSGRPFTTDTTIFYNTPDPASQDTWIYRHLVNGVTTTDEISVQSGDVWFTTDANVNNNGTASAYIYYTMAEINEGIYVDILHTNGGWKKAGMWDLRTYSTEGIMYAGSNYFEKINEAGTILYPTNNNQGNNSTRILCLEFAL